MSENKNIICNEFDGCDEIGFKVTCGSCHEVYYDLKLVDPTCPNCHTLHSKASAVKRRPSEEAYVFDDSDDEEEDTLDDLDLSL